MGKLIYQPKGKAYEYCHWACNLYNGCSNLCTYCYNRKGLAHNRLGKDYPTLKECVKSEDETKKEDVAFELFKKELTKYKERILADGGELFFNFVSDPALPETIKLNFRCMLFTMSQGVTCRVLTKRVEIVQVIEYYIKGWSEEYLHEDTPRLRDIPNFFSLLKVGFTLTGCDELEPGASPNVSRIYAMRKLRSLHIHTWASIEPIINIDKSKNMIGHALWAGCHEFKIGLLSGKKTYTPEEVYEFYLDTSIDLRGEDVVWKKSVLEYIKIIFDLYRL